MQYFARATLQKRLVQREKAGVDIKLWDAAALWANSGEKANVDRRTRFVQIKHACRDGTLSSAKLHPDSVSLEHNKTSTISLAEFREFLKSRDAISRFWTLYSSE